MEKTTACDGFAGDYSALLDGELDGEREAQLRLHLEGCAYCEAELEALRRVGPLLRAAPAPAVPSDLRARLQARIAASHPRVATETRPAPVRPVRDRQAPLRAPRRAGLRRIGIRPALGIGAAAAAAAALALILFQSGTRDERGSAPIYVLESTPPRAPNEGVEAAEVQIAIESALPADPAAAHDLLERDADLPQRAPEWVAEERVVEEQIVAAESPNRAAEAPVHPVPQIAEAKPGAAPTLDLLDIESASELAAVEIAVALELDTLEDLDVIANLELLERLIALEEGTG